MNVIGSDGEKIGTIDAVENTAFIVRKGIFPQDYYIPLSAISSQDDDTVYLSLSGHDALERGFANPTVAYMDTTPGNDLPTTIGTGTDEGRHEVQPLVDSEEALPTDIATAPGNMEDDRHRTIEVYEEEVAATTHPVERDVIRVRKTVVEERQTFEVPVTDEEVAITRRRVDRDITDDDHAFEEQSIEVRLRGEEVDLEKQARVVEEIDIDKTAHQHIEQVTETVRHEEIRIDDDTSRTERAGSLRDNDDSAGNDVTDKAPL
jgi:uncharacterized protein (TIGR02271 family)